MRYGSHPKNRSGAEWIVVHFLPANWGEKFWQLPENRAGCSLIGSCRRRSMDSYAYLRDVLTCLPTMTDIAEAAGCPLPTSRRDVANPSSPMLGSHPLF